MGEPEFTGTFINDVIPGQDVSTNEAMPRFGGRANPGDVMMVSVDGETTQVAPDPNGYWEFETPELANGEHELEMWVENEAGESSDPIEWEVDVESSEQDRNWQRARNKEWKDGYSGRAEERAGQPPLTPPRPVTGGGGGQEGEEKVDPEEEGASTESPPAAGFEKGNAPPSPRVLG
jgi:large repetitive protein